MSFTTKIQNYTNSTSSENVVDALNKGVNYTLAMVASVNRGLLSAFANVKDVSIVGGGKQVLGYDWMEDEKALYLLDVRTGGTIPRKNYSQAVPEKQGKDLEDPTSIYYALDDSPVYYLDGMNRLYMRPAPNGFALTLVKSADGRVINDSNETITDFPTHFLELPILHASECILMERLADFRAKLPTDLDADTTIFDQLPDVDLTITDTFPAAEYQDALDKAQNLIDGTTMGGDTETESAQYWLADEDEDMVGSTLSVASQELSRAQAILGEFNTTINANVTIKSQELQEFQANLQKKMGLFDKIIQKITVDYQWTQGQLQLVSGKKQEFIQTVIGTAGVKDNPKETKAL